jgi:hypothetical protein
LTFATSKTKKTIDTNHASTIMYRTSITLAFFLALTASAPEVGDTLEFRDQTSVELLGTAKVVSVEKTPDGPSLAINEKYREMGEFLVELDQPLNLPELSLVVMDGKPSCSQFVILAGCQQRLDPGKSPPGMGQSEDDTIRRPWYDDS